MSKTNITTWSDTASSNTDINSIDISEGCSPSNINNAMREIMKQVADINLGTQALSTIKIDNLHLDGNTIVTLDTNGDLNLTPNGTGSVVIAKVDINGGTIDGTPIGGASASTGAFTTLAASSTANLGSSVTISGGNIDGVIGANTPAAITGTVITANTNFAGNLTGNVTGTVDGVVGGTTPAAVTGTTITANTKFVGAIDGNVTATSGTSTFNNVTINGTLDMDSTTSQTITGLATPSGSTDAATKGYVDTEVSGLVDSAPAALNTLNELAAALGDDASFSTTITNSIAAKLPLAGGTMTGDIDANSNTVSGLKAPSSANDATTKTYVDTADALKLNLSGGTLSGNLAMGDNKVTGLAAPTADNDAARKKYVDDIAGSGTAAATSASAAATSATASATSATASASSATASAASATSAASSLDSFTDIYLGQKSSAPTVDNDGDALVTGALYWNTSSNDLYVWNGSAWEQGAFSTGGVLSNVVEDTTPQLGGDLDAQGKDIEDVGIVSADGIAGIYGSTSSPVTYTVTVASKTAAHPYNGDGSSSAYFLNGIESPALQLQGVDGTTANTEYFYKFDQAHSSNSGHPLRFYKDAAKAEAYTSGVTTNGTAGSSGAYTTIAVDDATPNVLYYECSSHAYMGNYVTTPAASVQGLDDAELTAIAGLTSAADKGIQFTGSGSAGVYDLTAAGKALLDDADAAAQRTTLGLGTAATTASTDYATSAQGTKADNAAAKASNLSDLASASTARTNLGLGTAATLAAGTSATNAVQLDSNAKLPAVDGSQLTNLPASGGSVDKTAKYAITAGQPVGLYSDGKVGLAKNWVDTANLSHTSGATTDNFDLYPNNGNNPHIVYSEQYDKYIVTFRRGSSSYYASYKVGTKSGTTITWGSEQVLVSEDMGIVKLHRVKDFEGNEMFVIVGSGGSSNSGYCRYGTATFNGSAFGIQKSMGNMNNSYLRNYNGNNPSLVSATGDWSYIRENSQSATTKPAGTYVAGFGALNAEYYIQMYNSRFFIRPNGSANDKYNYHVVVNSINASQYNYLSYPAAHSIVAHPTVPSFYYARKFNWVDNKVRVWRLYFNSNSYTGLGTSSNFVDISTTDSGGTTINTANWGYKDDTAIDLVITETGVGRCFMVRDKKIYAPKFNPNDASADGLNSGDITVTSGSFNEIVRINSNSSESHKLDISARVVQGKLYIMHMYYDSTQSSNSDKGRIYYGIRNLSDGISSAVTSEFSTYHQLYVSSYEYSQMETCDSGDNGSDIGWATQNRDYNNIGGHAGVWGAIKYDINDSYIGIAQSSVSANATVTIKLQGTEDDNQSGLTIAQKIQVKKDDGIISSSATVDTSTHKEIGIATSASTFLIKE